MNHRAIPDSEVVCLDAEGPSLFYELARRKASPVLCAFDILELDGDLSPPCGFQDPADVRSMSGDGLQPR